MISLLLRALVGAAAVVVIALLAKTRNYYVAGLVPLFPTLALIAHVVVGTERGAAGLRATALFGLWSLLPYAAYLLAVYHLAGRLRLPLTLLAATGVWIMVAAVLVFAWSRLHSPAA
ncbi:MAG: GlpM family protein [Longimicrobiaceae bacterium]